MNANTAVLTPPGRGAVLDDAHVGDIRGALGTIPRDDLAPRRNLSRRLKTLLAILGPGLIVMVGDNDAGAFGTYTQAGQHYGTRLLWAAVDGPGLRQPGDGRPPRRGHRRRARPADPRAVRPVLGRVQCDRPVPAERADDRDRVHRDRVGLSVPRPTEAPDGACRCGAGRRCGEHRQLSPVRAALPGARCRVAGADPDLPAGAPAGGAGGSRLRDPRAAARREALERDAVDHRDRRYHGRSAPAR